MIINETFINETFFESISSAIRSNWLTKKIKKKKRNAIVNEKINSTKMYLYMVKKEDLYPLDPRWTKSIFPSIRRS